MAKVDLLHVPYKGVGQALTDLLAGQVDLLFAPSQAVIQHVRAGKLKALATTSARRAETLPDLPTVAESGLPGYEAVGWFGLLAPAATPKSVVDKLSTDANRVLADPTFAPACTPSAPTPAATPPKNSPASSATIRPSGPGSCARRESKRIDRAWLYLQFADWW